jgi:hypothetical protein
MAEKTINTRILLKYDTYENWTTNNPVLKKGEIAIATIPSNKDGVQNAPSILIKVGDGTSAYKALKFVSGLAADVYGWAKAAEKPSYAASEITGLSDYISGKVQDTDTQYKIVKVDNYNYKLQSKALNGEWADVTGGAIAIPKYDDTGVKADIDALETLVGSTAVATQISTAINAIKDGTTIDSFADVETALEGKQATGDYATKTEAQGYANAKDTAIAAAKKAGDDAQAAVNTLTTTVETLVGDDANKSARAIAAEETAKIVAGADKSYDTLKEIADWISSHTTSATAMNTQINTNKEDIATLKTTTTGLRTDLDALDGSLAAIAKTGNINDLVQTTGDVLIFDCGNATI